MSEALKEETSQFFGEQLIISDAPTSLTEQLFIQQEEDHDEYEEQLFLDGVDCELLTNLHQLCRKWIRSGSDEFWRILNMMSVIDSDPGSRRRSSVRKSMQIGQMDMASKCMVSILNRLIHKSLDTQENVLVGIQAGVVYLTLLQMPGVQAYHHIFSSVILHNICSLLRLCLSVQELTDVELKDLYQQTVSLLDEFADLCQKVQLNGEVQTQLASVLVQVSQIGLNSKQTSIRDAAYGALGSLVNPVQCPKMDAISVIVLQELMPLLTLHLSFEQTTLTKAFTIEAEFGLQFVIQLLKKYEQLGFQGYVLAQQLAYNVVDKADYRAFTSKAVLQLLPLLEQEALDRYVQWIFMLSCNPKNALRSFSFDLLSQIALSKKIKVDKIVHEGIVDILRIGVMDKIPTVRARAVSSLAAIIEYAMENVECRHLLTSVQQNITELEFVIVQRANDEKSVVRRPALLVLKLVITAHFLGQLQSEDVSKLLQCLSLRARDAVMTMRRSVVRYLTDLVLLFPQDVTLWILWKETVFNSIGDTELSVQEEAVSCFNDVVCVPLLDKSTQYIDQFCQTLATLSKNHQGILMKLLESVERKYAIEARQVSVLVDSVTVHNQQSVGHWLLLSCFSKFANGMKQPPINQAHAQVGWEMVKSNLKVLIAPHVLHVMQDVCKSFSKASLTEVLQQIMSFIRDLQAPVSLLAPLFETLHVVTEQLKDTSDWQKDLMVLYENKLNDIIDRGARVKEEAAVRVIFSLGELSVLCPKLVNDNLTDKLMILVAASSTPEVKTTAIHAHAFIALGKISLINDRFAKQHVPVFARELENSKDSVIRNNAMMILCDLCKRYTRVVDPYIPTVANCLADANPSVRVQVLVMLTKLLQEDYIKWKGTLLFKFLYAAVDLPQIRLMARDCLDTLMNKNAQMMYSSFVDAIYFFNSATFGKFSFIFGSEQENAMFTLKGLSGQVVERRREIYDYCLQQMPDEYRFQLTRKLCTDVLKTFVEDGIDLETEAEKAVLLDTLHVLASKGIKSNMKPLKQGEGEDDEEISEAAEKKLNQLSNKIHSQISRKIAVENIIPIVIKMKHKLEQSHSPLLKNLMMYLREVVSDFRVELEDIMASDRQLAQEIEYDLRVFEKSLTEPVAVLETAMEQTAVHEEASKTPRRVSQSVIMSAARRSNSSSVFKGLNDSTTFTIPRLKPNTQKRKTVTFSEAPKIRVMDEVFSAPVSPISHRDSIASTLNATFEGSENLDNNQKQSTPTGKHSIGSSFNNLSDSQWNVESPPSIRPRSKRSSGK